MEWKFGNGKKKRNWKTLDYVRWLFRLEFCTSIYIITKELRMNKLKVRWGGGV